MNIENLTGQDRILLWDITGQHPANERADAVAKAFRLIDKLTEALAAAERGVSGTCLQCQARIELAALRERVAFAIAWLTDIEPKPHSKSWNALEVLRGPVKPGDVNEAREVLR